MGGCTSSSLGTLMLDDQARKAQMQGAGAAQKSSDATPPPSSLSDSTIADGDTGSSFAHSSSENELCLVATCTAVSPGSGPMAPSGGCPPLSPKRLPADALTPCAQQLAAHHAAAAAARISVDFSPFGRASSDASTSVCTTSAESASKLSALLASSVSAAGIMQRTDSSGSALLSERSCLKREGSGTAGCSTESQASSVVARGDVARAAVESTLLQLLHLPYDDLLRGAPPPRMASGSPRVSLHGFEYLQQHVPPQVDDLLGEALLEEGLDAAVVTVNSSRRVWVRNAWGFRPGHFRWDWPAWQLRAPDSQLVVQLDIASGPAGQRVQCLAGAPLLAADGLVLGCLAVVGSVPRQLSPKQSASFSRLAVNVAAAVAADQDAQQRLRKRPSTTVEPHAVLPLLRDSLAPLSSAVLVVDCAHSRGAWQALHGNPAVTLLTGITLEDEGTVDLWALFDRLFVETSEAWDAISEVAARGDEFILRSVVVSGAAHRGTFALQFRPADQGGLDDGELEGLPAETASCSGMAGHLYFVIATAEPPAADCAASLGMYGPVQALNASRNQALDSALIPGLQLGPVIGRGSFGTVYRGRFRGQRVAIKVCQGRLQPGKKGSVRAWRSLEARQHRRLRHPNIVAALKHTTVLVQENKVASKSWSKTSSEGRASCRRRAKGSADPDDWNSTAGSWPHCSGGGSDSVDTDQASWSSDDSVVTAEPSVDMETWLVMEHCNRGCLKAALQRGLFRNPSAGEGAPPCSDTAAVLATAAEIADAMAYLHAKHIVHGDLSCSNVLLTSSTTAPHGFTAKISDFGLSRELKTAPGLHTKTYGTVTHMPPELLLDNKLTKASDVFAYGVLLFELACCRQAWEGMSHTQVLAAVTLDRRRLAFDPHVLPGIVELSERCTAFDSAQRPTFQECQAVVAALRQSLLPTSA